MSQAKGAAYGSFGEIAGAAVGNNRIIGMAFGENVVWEMGAEIYDIISFSENVPANENVEITISCNKQTQYVVTYIVSGNSLMGHPRTITDIVDTDGGKRNITFTVSFGSRGNKMLRIYGAAQQASATQYQSLNYKDVELTIT